MNRRDLLKVLTAIIPASWLPKARAVELSPSEPPKHVWVARYTPCDASAIEVTAGEDTDPGDLVTVHDGVSSQYLCALSHLAPVDVPYGIARHRASKGSKLLVQMDGCLVFGANPSYWSVRSLSWRRQIDLKELGSA